LTGNSWDQTVSVAFGNDRQKEMKLEEEILQTPLKEQVRNVLATVTPFKEKILQCMFGIGTKDGQELKGRDCHWSCTLFVHVFKDQNRLIRINRD
jgi:hypothetical protein